MGMVMTHFAYGDVCHSRMHKHYPWRVNCDIFGMLMRTPATRRAGAGELVQQFKMRGYLYTASASAQQVFGLCGSWAHVDVGALFVRWLFRVHRGLGLVAGVCTREISTIAHRHAPALTAAAVVAAALRLHRVKTYM